MIIMALSCSDGDIRGKLKMYSWTTHYFAEWFHPRIKLSDVFPWAPGFLLPRSSGRCKKLYWNEGISHEPVQKRLGSVELSECTCFNELFIVWRPHVKSSDWRLPDFICATDSYQVFLLADLHPCEIAKGQVWGRSLFIQPSGFSCW